MPALPKLQGCQLAEPAAAAGDQNSGHLLSLVPVDTGNCLYVNY
jgi:hypothetical protein